MRELARRVQGVVAHDDGADPHRRVVGDHVLRTVREDERDAVTGPDAEPREDGGEPLHALEQRPVALVLAEERGGRTPRMPAGRILQHREHRPVGVRGERPRNVRRVVVEPRPILHGRGYFHVAGTPATRYVGSWKPFSWCVPSQNGLFDEAPQRQKKASVARITVRPVPETTSSAPLTISGPFTSGFT